ncbi:MAG: ATPase [Rhodomicrobium sp.]|nr:MAG: ATPase [Rhodomicrobium sp.]
MAHREIITRSNLRLRTIVRLRWIAVAGQLAAVFFVYFWLEFSFPILFTLMAIALSAVINVVVHNLFKNIKMVTNQLGTWMLAYDIVQLALLLYLTGGILNPFASLLVAPIAISAASLGTRSTVTLSILALLAASLISFDYMPLPWYTAGGLVFPDAYRLGNWVSLICAMAFIGFFSWRISNESRVMSAALAATEATLAREQKLSAIDGLAAAAAHGLGTPLSTIFLVAKELERELPQESPMREDISLIRSQAVRCREILQSLSDVGSHGDFWVETSTVEDILEEVAQPLKALDENISVKVGPKAETMPPYDKEPVIYRNPGIIYALGNIVENAVEFSKSHTELNAEWDAHTIRLEISDDGPGFSSELLKKLGEPFVSTRATLPAREDEEEAFGMGLGFFISKTLLERSGAEMEFGNRRAPGKGAYVILEWPRKQIDIGLQETST